MDRVIIYPGSLPQDVDILQPQRNAMIALGFLAQAVFGPTTVCDGLSCTPTAPASMSVNVGPGTIIQNSVVDQNTYGSLAADTSDALVKCGINIATTVLGPFTPPGTAGFSQNFLIQAALSEQDGGATVLPYYNAANPATPYSGPNNSGSSQNTTRTQTVNLQIKAGSAATTGSQTTPAPDSGFVGLWVVTIANGASSLVASNITMYGGAPFVPFKLVPGQARIRLKSDISLYVATNGSDTANSGTSSLSAFATLQRAWNVLQQNYDLNGFNATVNIANGTYTGGLAAQGVILGQGQGNKVSFVGNVGSPGNVVISTTNAHAIAAANGAQISISGMQLQATGTSNFGGSTNSATGVFANSSSYVTIAGNMNFATCAGPHMWANQGGAVFVGSGYTINGSAFAHYESSGNAQVLGAVSGPTITLSGTPAFSAAFAYTGDIGLIRVLAITFSGAATGQRYSVSADSVIDTAGAGASYFPGTIAGTFQTGGQYI